MAASAAAFDIEKIKQRTLSLSLMHSTRLIVDVDATFSIPPVVAWCAAERRQQQRERRERQPTRRERG